MQIKPAIGLTVGPVSDTHWGQVLSSPTSYAIVEIDEPKGTAREIGVGVLSQLGRNLAKPPGTLKALESIADQLLHPSVRSLIILVPVGNIVYLVVRGVGSVYIKRGNELASLMHSNGAISGEVKTGDTILLSSAGFTGVLDREELTRIFNRQPPAQIAEKLTLVLHEKTGGEGSVALVFAVTDIVKSAPSESERQPAPPDRTVRETHPAPAETRDTGKPPRTPWKPRISFPAIPFEPIRARIASVRTDPHLRTKLIVFCLAFLFVVSVILGLKKEQTAAKNSQVSGIIKEARHAMEEGAAVQGLNPMKARERLTEAKRLIEPLRETVPERTAQGREIALLYQKITDNLTLAMNIVTSPVDTFYDMALLKKNAVVSTIDRDGTTIVIGDKATNTVYTIDLISKKAEVLGGGVNLKNISLVAMHGPTVYVLTDDGVMKLSSGDAKPAVAIKKDEEWGTITAMVSFGGNIYLLDTIKSRIWKYVATEKGFSERREFLNPDTLPDLTRAITMSIDGSVILGTAKGAVWRFTQGRENTLPIKGVEPPFGPMLRVYTTDETKNIYVLDTGNNRVVVLDKEGLYIAQYPYESLNPTGFLVFEEQKKILLTEQGKLYTIELK